MLLDKGGRSDRDVVYPLKFIGINLRWSHLLSLKIYAAEKYFIPPRGVCDFKTVLCKYVLD